MPDQARPESTSWITRDNIAALDGVMDEADDPPSNVSVGVPVEDAAGSMAPPNRHGLVAVIDCDRTLAIPHGSRTDSIVSPSASRVGMASGVCPAARNRYLHLHSAWPWKNTKGARSGQGPPCHQTSMQ